MANKKHLRKFGVNESISVRVPNVSIIILHNSPKRLQRYVIFALVALKGLISSENLE